MKSSPKMKLKTSLVVAALAVSPVLSTLALAAKPPTACCTMPPQADKMTPAQFAQTVATVDMLEIKLGEVAQTNANLPAVKSFGAYMVKSHTAIGRSLSKVAAAENIALPTALDKKHQAILNKLSALKGTAFDKAYIPAMVEGHTKVLAMFQSFDQCCKDPEFKKFADKTTPIIAAHLKNAKKVQMDLQKLGVL